MLTINILRGLNEKQIRAVLHHQGPLLVLAGPGTGKTKVVTHRIAYLVRRYNVPPENIMAVTFTNKAAQEMSERINQLLGTRGLDVWIGTFHAACVRMLREHGSEMGLNRNFAIFDQETQDEVIAECARDLRLSLSTYPVWFLRDIISAMKVQMQDPSAEHDFIRTREGDVIEDPIEQQDVANLLKSYQEKLALHGALDFDDLISKTVQLLSQVPTVRDEYRRRIHYILVDEFQDINFAQYELLRQLCGKQKNIMVVADDDQAIYSWRGSSPAYIDRFKVDFGDNVIELEEHYRSTQKLLRAAQSLIEHNNRQKTSVLTTTNESGYTIFHYNLDSAGDEPAFVAKLIRQLVEQRRYSYGDIAIFYRTHRLADQLEEHLLRERIQVQRVRRLSTFQEGGGNDIVAQLKFLHWRLDRDLKRAINFPQLVIDELTMVKLEWLAKQGKITLRELFSKIDDYRDEIGPLTRRNIKRFMKSIDEFAKTVENRNISSIVLDFFKFLEARRNPYSSEDIESIEAEREIRGLSTAADVLYRAVSLSEKISLHATYGIDNYCAAKIIHQTLSEYLDADVELNLLPRAGRAPITNHQSAVDILIGSFDEIPDGETQAILIGTAKDSKGCIILQYPDDEVPLSSLIALKLSQRLLSYFEAPNLEGLIIYDLETIGNEARNAVILEIAADQLDATGSGVRHYHQFVNPRIPIPKSSTRIHGINDKTVENKPSIEAVLPEFLNFIGDSILIGHNIEEFDNRVIDREMGKHLEGRGLSNPFYDTYSTARRLYPRENCKLEALADKFGVEHEDLHHALEDVSVTRQVFESLSREDRRRREQCSLPEMLPLVAVGLLEKDALIEDTADTLKNRRAYYQAAARYIQNHRIELDWLIEQVQPAEQELVSRFARDLRTMDIVQSNEETLWRSLRGNFMNSVLNFESNSKRKDLPAFLDYQSLVSGVDETKTDEDKVTLMTLHSAKGTEFPVVIMIGMEEGVFPIYRSNQP
ncbi:MAG: UvrD-helicase domain-containing protein, partial [Candidatus Poribacteria bacterium]